MIDGSLLVTGGTGYLGRRLARAWLDAGGDQVIVWVRAREAADLARLRAELADGVADGVSRLVVASGDLASDRAFENVDPGPIRAIVHAAAATRFNIDEATATVNVEGTRRLLTFARRCPGLADVTVLSSIYASGLRAGTVVEEPLDEGGRFANHYERSKWASEHVLLREFSQLPWRIARVATVIADDDAGRVTQQNAFHNTLKLFYYGLLSVVPGQPDTLLYFVTGDFVTDALVRLVGQAPARSIVHLAHTGAESETLGALVDTAFEVFGEDPEFKKRRVLKPLYSDADAFDLLADGAQSFAGGVVTQALSSVRPFAHQLFVSKDVRNDRLRAALPDYRAPDPRRLIAGTCRQLVATRWGRAEGRAHVE
jgi:nucleoside-diphosphate-sugar epimerase